MGSVVWMKSYSVGEAAKLLGVSPCTVRRRVKAGEIRGFKAVSGRYRIPKDEVERLVPSTVRERKEVEEEGREETVNIGEYQETALYHLRRGIDLSGKQLQDPELDDETKVRWAHCMAQLVAALVNLSKGLGTKDEEESLAKLFAKLDSMPKKYRKIVVNLGLGARRKKHLYK